MTKTEHLDLCRWTEDDAVSVDEINRNFEILEKGIPLAWEKLMEVTTGENADAVELDFSGLDLTRYDGLRITLRMRTYYGTSSSDGSHIYLRYNNLAGGYTGALQGGSVGTDVKEAGIFRIRLTVPSIAVLTLWWRDGTLYSYLRRLLDNCMDFALPDCTYCTAALQTVNLTAVYAGQGIAAGAGFEVWGMKKCS